MGGERAVALIAAPTSLMATTDRKKESVVSKELPTVAARQAWGYHLTAPSTVGKLSLAPRQNTENGAVAHITS